jgi:hypothetical protein
MLAARFRSRLIAPPSRVLYLSVAISAAVCLLSPVRHSQAQQAKASTDAPASQQEFLDSILRGNEESFRSCLRRNANPNRVFNGTADAPVTPLFLLIVRDEERLARILLAQSPKLNLNQTYNGYTARDLASYLQLEGLASAIATEEQIRTPSSAAMSANRIAWIANGITELTRTRDQPTALGLNYLTHAFRTSASPDRAAILTRATALRDACRARLTETRSPMLTEAELQSLLFSHVRDARVAELVSKDISQSRIHTTFAGTSSESLDDIRSRAQSYLSLTLFIERTLDATYQLATADGVHVDVKPTIIQFVGAAIGATLGMDAQAIADANPSNFNTAIRELFGAAAPDVPALKQAWTKVFDGIKTNSQQALTQLQGARPPDQSPASTVAARVAATYAPFESAVFTLTSFARIAGDTALSNDIHAFGMGAIQIGKSISTFVTSGLRSLVAYTTLVGGILDGVSMVCSLFGSGPPLEQQILTQLAELRRQVQDLRDEMHQEFENVENRLNVIYNRIMLGFQALEIDVAQVRDQLNQIGWQLALVESEVSTLEPHIQQYFQDTVDTLLWRQVQLCIDWSKTQTTRLPYAEFLRAMDLLRLAATREAQQSVVVRGLPLSPEDLADDTRLSHRFLAFSVNPNNGFDVNIGLLQSLAQRFDSGGIFPHDRLVNPVRWSIMADAYARLALDYPDYFIKRMTVAGVDEMLDKGRTWQAALKKLSDPDPETGAYKSLYKNVIDYYSSRAEFFRGMVRDYTERFQVDQAEGYNLWGGAAQTPRTSLKLPTFGVTELPPSDDFDFANPPAELPSEVKYWKNSKNLQAPRELVDVGSAQRVLQGQLLIAHHLQCGQITATWRDPDWEEVYRKKLSESEDRIHGKAGVRVVLSFVKSGQKLPIFSQRINTGHDFEYGIQTFHVNTVPNVPATARAPFPLQGRMATFRAVRGAPNWGHGNMMHDPRDRVLIQEEIVGHWPEMVVRVFQGYSAGANPQGTVQSAAQSVEEKFQKLRADLDQSIRADTRVIEAKSQLSAARGMLATFMQLGISGAIADDPELRGLLEGDGIEKGKTRLLDGPIIDTLGSKGIQLHDIATDVEWLNSPKDKLENKLQHLPAPGQSLPLVERTMEQLSFLRDMHERGQPAQPIQQAVAEIRAAAQGLVR